MLCQGTRTTIFRSGSAANAERDLFLAFSSGFSSVSNSASSDVPGWAWAQASGLGWAFKGSGLRKVKPDPKLLAGLGLGLVGLEPGLP